MRLARPAPMAQLSAQLRVVATVSLVAFGTSRAAPATAPQPDGNPCSGATGLVVGVDISSAAAAAEGVATAAGGGGGGGGTQAGKSSPWLMKNLTSVEVCNESTNLST